MTELLQLFLNGVFTGTGSAVGGYLATRMAIKKFERLERRLLRRRSRRRS